MDIMWITLILHQRHGRGGAFPVLFVAYLAVKVGALALGKSAQSNQSMARMKVVVRFSDLN
jgi:hypothetical protein